MIRSVCRDLSGDSTAASELTHRALSRTFVLDAIRRRRLDSYRALYEPLPADGRPDLRPPWRMMAGPATDISGRWPFGRLLDGTLPAGPGRVPAASQRRIRYGAAPGNGSHRQPGAAGSGRNLRPGGTRVGVRIAGDLVSADELATTSLERGDALGWGSQQRMAPAWLARGIACYWNDDLTAARTCLAKAQRLGSELFPSGPLSAIYRVLVDCGTGDLAATRRLQRGAGVLSRTWTVRRVVECPVHHRGGEDRRSQGRPGRCIADRPATGRRRAWRIG